jgi:hypothetical protein
MNALAIIEGFRDEMEAIDLMYGPEKNYSDLVAEYSELFQNSELAQAGRLLVKEMESDERSMSSVEEKP